MIAVAEWGRDRGCSQQKERDHCHFKQSHGVDPDTILSHDEHFSKSNGVYFVSRGDVTSPPAKSFNLKIHAVIKNDFKGYCSCCFGDNL